MVQFFSLLFLWFGKFEPIETRRILCNIRFIYCFLSFLLFYLLSFLRSFFFFLSLCQSFLRSILPHFFSSFCCFCLFVVPFSLFRPFTPSFSQCSFSGLSHVAVAVVYNISRFTTVSLLSVKRCCLSSISLYQFYPLPPLIFFFFSFSRTVANNTCYLRGDREAFCPAAGCQKHLERVWNLSTKHRLFSPQGKTKHML